MVICLYDQVFTVKEYFGSAKLVPIFGTLVLWDRSVFEPGAGIVTEEPARVAGSQRVEEPVHECVPVEIGIGAGACPENRIPGVEGFNGSAVQGLAHNPKIPGSKSDKSLLVSQEGRGGRVDEWCELIVTVPKVYSA